MVQYIEHIFQQFISVKFVVVNWCVGKKWLFWFCEGSACVWGKTKCAICTVAFLSVSFLSAVQSNRLAPNSNLNTKRHSFPQNYKTLLM